MATLKTKQILAVLALSMSILTSATPAMAYTTKTVTYKADFFNIFGITIATHNATTYWSYNGTAILTGYAHGAYNGWWTAPGLWVDGSSSSWDWFNSSNARSNNKIVLHAGIPTPWGPVGSSRTSRWLTTVYGNGTSSGSHM